MKKSTLTAQQKKEKAFIAVLSIIAVIMLIFSVKAFSSENVPDTAVKTTVSQATETTTAPTTTSAPTTAAPATEKTQETTKSEPEKTTKPEQTTVSPADETEEILRAVSDGVNALKASDASFTGHKVQNINIRLVDSSVPAVNNIINGVIQAFVKEEILDYDFTNGISSDPEGDGTVTANETFPPGDKPFELTKEGVARAYKDTDGENTVYTVVIVPEKSTLENPRPPYHNSAADTLDLSSVEIPIITLTKVDFDYSGATVSVTLNPDGEVVGYYEKLPISGTGEGHGLGITGYGTIEGYLEENWDIQWK